MRFLIFTFCDPLSRHEGPTFGELSKLTLPSKEQYAKIHSYDFYNKAGNFDKNKSIGWAKIDIILDKINQYDWLFYVECDAMIMNPTIRLQNLVDENYDIIISRSKCGEGFTNINTGILLIKCSEWSKQFFNKLNTKQNYFNNNWFEQGAIIQELDNSEILKHFKFVQNRFFNSFYHRGDHIFLDENFKVGDFICHAAGISNESRYSLFTELQNKVIKYPENKDIKTPFF